MNILKSSITLKIVLPTLLLILLAGAGSFLFMSASSESNTIDAVVRNSTQMIQQFKLIRGYYTKNVIQKVIAQGIAPSFDHADNPRSIPLPATFIHELSELFLQKEIGTQLRLYSEFPFPNRADRKLDDFAKSALLQLQSDPQQIVVGRGILDGEEVVRVATGDTMSVQACVSCHNSHPDSPKTDWKLGELRGALEIITPIAHQMENNHAMTVKVGLITLVISALVALALALITIRYVKSPLHNMGSALEEIASDTGDFTKKISIHSNDEIGHLAATINRMMSKLNGMFCGITTYADKILSSSQEFNATTDELARTSKAITDQSNSVAGTTEEMSMTIHNIASSIEEASINIASISSASDQMSQNMTTVSGAMQQMTTSMDNVVQNANDTSAISSEGSKLAQEASETMQSLGKAGFEIGAVTDLIKRIADRTNLLALNANIEAASAGEFGKGFGVVADEIKELANQSANAADVIGQKIESIRTRSDDAVSVIQRVTEIMSNIDVSIQSINENVKQQSQTAEEISSSIGQTAEGAQSIAHSISEVSHAANEISNNVGQASSAANEVADSIRNVNSAAQDGTEGIQGIVRESRELLSVAEEMRSMVDKFNLDMTELP